MKSVNRANDNGTNVIHDFVEACQPGDFDLQALMRSKVLDRPAGTWPQLSNRNGPVGGDDGQ